MSSPHSLPVVRFYHFIKHINDLLTETYSMKNITLVAAALLIAGIAEAQTPAQPVQKVQQPVTTTTSSETSTQRTGQVPQTTQGVRTTTQAVQTNATGQVPKTRASQDANLLGRPQQSNAVLPATNAQSASDVDVVSEQTNVTDQQTAVPAVTEEQVKQVVEETNLNVKTVVQPVNAGTVPKTYSNTQQDPLPYRQYQPKPTGRIAPEGVTPRAAPARIR